ncbi:MAG: Lrp/AsnC family transcriptional regulator [Candidatus Helarchaeota archaeon]|nr:Lrp/AsnC family transcriptional regulator [Candidatus Helarchaeota archaeon]
MKLINQELKNKVLKELLRDYRSSVSELADKLKVSKNKILTVVNFLKNNEYINGHTIITDPYLLQQRTLFIEIKTNPNEPWLINELEKFECESLDGIIGEYSLILKIKIRNNAEFNQILKKIDKLMAKGFFKKYQLIDVLQTYKENGVSFQNQAKFANLDNIGYEIIKILKNQSINPYTTSEISNILNSRNFSISQPGAWKRIDRMVKAGIIKNFVPTLNRDIFQLTKFYLRIKVDPAQYDEIAKNFLSQQKNIVDLYRTGENYGLLAVVFTKSNRNFNEFIIKLYNSGINIIDTNTTLAIDERLKKIIIPDILI